MELIISKGFVSKIESCSKNNSIFNDFIDFFKKDIVKNIVLITDFKDYLEFEMYGKYLNPLWEVLVNRGIKDIKYYPNLYEVVDNQDFYEGDSLKLFCVDLEKERCDQLEKRYGFEFLNFEDIDNEWKPYCLRDFVDMQINKTSDITVRFDNWEKIVDFKHPVHSIIIFDKYLFTEYKKLTKENRKVKQYDVKDNFFLFLRYLIDDNNSEVDITIFTDRRNIDTLNMPNDYNERMDFFCNRINNFLRQNYSKVKFNISIVHYDKRLHNGPKEHARGIYTNYYFFGLDQGVNIFDPNGNIINRDELRFRFNFRQRECHSALSGLRSFKGYIESLKNRIQSGKVKNDQELFFGSIKNKLFDRFE